MAAAPPKEWGPPLWQFLHNAAECLGTQTHAILKKDEANQWALVLNTLNEAMPCVTCQKHYKEWLKKHPSEQFRSLEGEALREAARKWLWELHNTVNQRNGGDAFSYESTLSTYSQSVQPAEFRRLLDEFTKKSQANGEPMRKFRRYAIILLKLINKV